MNQKEQRHQALLDLISNMRIETQIELVEKMNEKGFSVTQATVSRDVDVLGIVKTRKGYELPFHLREDTFWTQTVKQHVLSVDKVGEHLLVVRTHESAALLFARDLDEEKIQGVVGTIAGSDTVFVALESQEIQKKLFIKIEMSLS